MLGVNFAGGNSAAVSDPKRFSLSSTRQCDLAANHQDARIPIMCVIRVDHPRLEPAVEDLITLSSQFGFEFALLHKGPPICRSDYCAGSPLSSVLGNGKSRTLHRATRAHVLRSSLSFARASATVCHCIFTGVSGPPQASG